MNTTKSEVLKRLLRDLNEGDENERKYAAEDIGYDGYIEAVPDLIKHLTDPSIAVAETCVSALVRIGTPEIAEAIAEKLGSEDVRLRNYAVELLLLLGEISIDVLEKQLVSDDRDVRKFSVDILLELGSDRSINALVKALDDEDVNIAATAADGLGSIGKEEHIEVLQKHMNSEVWMRCAVIRGIGSIGGTKAMAAILPALHDEDMMVKISAIQSLAKIRKLESLTDLLHLLDREALSLFGGETIAAIQAIIEENPDEDYQGIIPVKLINPILDLTQKGNIANRLQALSILEALKFDHGLKVLINLIKDENDEIVDALVKTIVAVNPEDIVLLKKFLSPEEQSTTKQKIAILRILGGLSNLECIPILIEYLDPNEEELTCAALESIPSNISPVPEKEIYELLQSDITQVRVHAAELMGRIGTEIFCEVLINQLDDLEPEVQEMVDNALVAIGTNNKNSLMKPYLDSFTPRERKIAFEYYGSHYPEEINEKYIDGLNDADENIRVISFKALGNLGLLKHDMMIKGLNDDSENVNIEAARSFCNLPESEGVLNEISKILKITKSERVKVELIQVLAKYERLDVISIISPLLQDDSVWVQIETVEALKALGDSSVVESLKALLTSANDELLDAVESAIEELDY